MIQLSEPERIPPKEYRQRIEKLAEQISDPVKKLRFIHQALADYSLNESVESGGKHRRKTEAAKGGESLFRKNGNHRPEETGGAEYRLQPPLAGKSRHYLVYLVCGMGVMLFGFAFILFLSNGSRYGNLFGKTAAKTETDVFHYIIPTVTSELSPAPVFPKALPGEDAQKPPAFPEYLDTLIWMIEKTAESEYYSNRLRIHTGQTVDNTPRRYRRIPIQAASSPNDWPATGNVAGILFHAAESDIYEFKPEMTQSIKEYSRLLARYLRKKKAYHYFIDRFGEVYRLVREDHAAYHAGNSIWADSENIYLDLNNAFIGICFEGKDFEHNPKGKSKTGGNGDSTHIVAMAQSSINEAQLRSGKELTDWLRVKYRISQKNCVPHALASVNPYDLLIGHHLDLSYEFPFDMFGLSNKYEEPIPAITEFGFSCNNYFVQVMKGRLWPGIIRSEETLRQRADETKIPLKEYRKLLNNRFAGLFKWQKQIKQSEGS
ncbi:MAG: N-acetylmuramoyl-L-alanine amidase [Thermodesulfobacteriota bacterium]